MSKRYGSAFHKPAPFVRSGTSAAAHKEVSTCRFQTALPVLVMVSMRNVRCAWESVMRTKASARTTNARAIPSMLCRCRSCDTAVGSVMRLCHCKETRT
jgi:hypothetical protein